MVFTTHETIANFGQSSLCDVSIRLNSSPSDLNIYKKKIIIKLKKKNNNI